MRGVTFFIAFCVFTVLKEMKTQNLTWRFLHGEHLSNFSENSKYPTSDLEHLPVFKTRHSFAQTNKKEASMLRNALFRSLVSHTNEQPLSNFIRSRWWLIRSLNGPSAFFLHLLHFLWRGVTKMLREEVCLRYYSFYFAFLGCFKERDR